MVYHAIRKKDVQNFLKLALFITKNGNALGVPDPKYHFFGFFSDNYKILHQFLPGFLKKHKKGHIVPTLLFIGVISTGLLPTLDMSAAHFPVPYAHKY